MATGTEERVYSWDITSVAANLHVDEAVLTGESVPVRKQTDPVAAEAVVAECCNMAFKGSSVTQQSSFLEGQAPRYIARSYSEATAEAMDAAVRGVLREVSDEALEILTQNRDILETSARRLLEVETLDEAELRDLARGLSVDISTENKGAVNE
ncbi:peptidase M41 [Dinoroseobacter shibae DFL 12 = DSM 16493]|jgi:cell division protease FtsH|uniref:Peptidase M41 n=1 Tax=Dinoroseobacter shibae (strain DSM 16493 / NCIMB 14021 / DFL 12) TaxID=398580 RepID=A8LN29_DINSH|nr:peptidase M41 [Dinoroseobacter shibae]ABV92173.1 peptidase M41 [Dinoroseobacter shibae DFL 12 = DSM 16493]URF47128.1 hypothetical protein M8008_02175 [Dinoroseobacter shibae]URF51439.1 hypothetical protein M8007_02175 [Dinoroseobacter shibae]